MNSEAVKGLEENIETPINTSKKRSKKKYYIAAGIIGAAIVYGVISSNSAIKYEMVKAARKDIREVVEITGNVEAGASIALNFRSSGQIESIPVEVGSMVSQNAVIATLKNRDQQLKVDQARANLSGAQANLNEKIAGETEESIRIAIAGVKEAEAAAEKTWIDYGNAEKELELTKKKYEQDEKKAQLMVDEAKSDYDFAVKNQTNTGKTNELAIETAKKDLEAQIYSTGNQIQSSLFNVKSVIIDDGTSIIAEDMVRLDYEKLSVAREKYYKATQIFTPMYQEFQSKQNYKPAELEAFSKQEQEAITNLLQSQKSILDAFAILPVSTTLTAAEIDQIKTNITANTNSLASSYSSLNAKYQAILDAELGETTSGDSKESEVSSAKSLYEQQLQTYQQTLIDHEVEINRQESNIRSLKAQHDMQLAKVDSANANLDMKKTPPRAVDIAFLKAQVAVNQIAVALAEEDLEKTILRAPMSGTLSRKNVEIGEDVNAGGTATGGSFEMISDQKFKIDANIAEVDIGKIKVGTKVKITLDAVGAGETFDGEIVRIDPVETVIQDVIFYKTEILINSEDERIKPGMTANVEIIINERKQVITVPEKAVLSDGDKKIVREQVAGKVVNIPVQTGIRDIQGNIEILSGLKEGQEIILRTLNGRN